MPSLKEVEGRLFRKTPESYKHMTVYGNHELTTFTCVVCGKKGYLSEAYLKSKDRRKHDSDVRPYHASCYNETNGKYRQTESKSRIKLTGRIEATLEHFIME